MDDSEGRWLKFWEEINRLNTEGKKHKEEYKVFFVGRHGESIRTFWNPDSTCNELIQNVLDNIAGSKHYINPKGDTSKNHLTADIASEREEKKKEVSLSLLG